MNGESFYDSFQDWHPPSPRSTPQSAKFGFFPFTSPIATGASPIQVQHGWMTSQPPVITPISQAQSSRGQEAAGRHSNSTASKRQRPQSVGYSPGMAGQQHNSAHILNLNFTHAQSSFPSGSFVERFDSTTLDDPFTGPPGMSASTPATQMRTPPPTRDDSTRRKPHQPRLVEFQTPSTIVSRRMSVPNDTWQQHPSDTPFPDPSPFTFTPLQFSPPPSHFGFAPSGPMTAPVYPQSNLFWDPNSNQPMSHVSFSAMAEDPFGLNPSGMPPSSFTFEPPHPSNHRLTTSASFSEPAHMSQNMPRPQSARPADPRHEASLSRASFAPSSSSSVDPNVLWNTQNADMSSFPRRESVTQQVLPENRQPYQHQTESLRREKEERARRGRASSGQNAADPTPSSADRNLRRSLTDSRARKSGSHSQLSSQASFTNASDASYSFNSAHIPREASPLKRHKPASQNEQLTPTKSSARKSVVLTVDEKGRARTEVKPIAEAPPPRQLFRVARSLDDDSDSSDLPDNMQRSLNASSGGLGSSPPSSDAQDALREVVRNRKIKRQELPRGATKQPANSFPANLPYSSLPSSASKSNQNNSNSSQSNNSPTTITDPDFHTPTRDANVDSSGNTRCICNGRVPDHRANLMIECESCKNWLHVACLGISPEQIPLVFVCLFCSSTPATRGGRVRPYAGGPYQGAERHEPHDYL